MPKKAKAVSAVLCIFEEWFLLCLKKRSEKNGEVWTCAFKKMYYFSAEAYMLEKNLFRVEAKVEIFKVIFICK